jgi:tetratricopeptide (TPR) repeat protein
VEEALGLIEKAVALDPENGAYLDSLGWALFRLSRYEQAETHLRKALSKDARNAVILDHLADTLNRRGRLEEALAYWRQALQGEDEDEELDRAAVERKIREAQLHLETQNKNPNNPE